MCHDKKKKNREVVRAGEWWWWRCHGNDAKALRWSSPQHITSALAATTCPFFYFSRSGFYFGREMAFQTKTYCSADKILASLSGCSVSMIDVPASPVDPGCQESDRCTGATLTWLLRRRSSTSRGQTHDALASSPDLIIPLDKGDGSYSAKSLRRWGLTVRQSACVGHTLIPESMKFTDKRNEEVQFQISESLSRAKL